MKQRFPLLIFGAFLFLFFIFFSYLVHKNLFVHLDFNTTVRLQDHISRRFDGVFSILSDIGQFEVMVVLLIGLLFFRRKVLGILTLGLFGLFHLIELYGKFFVNHLPPPEFMVRTEKLVNFPQFYVRAQNSYPSGHAGRAAFITTLIGVWVWQSKKLSQRTKICLLVALGAYDIAMFITRIYLGEHWTTDVIGGAMLGAALALLAGAI